MKNVPYPYIMLQQNQYIFVSEGRTRIAKAVEFVPAGIDNVMSLSLGDLLSDNSIDYEVSSNNGDISKVLVTVVEILKDFTSRYPMTQIFIRGNSEIRNKLYHRILKMNYTMFSQEYIISVLL